MKPSMKIASRFFLPVEMFLGVAMTGWGVSGWVGKGSLWGTLAAVHGNTDWGFYMVIIGLTQLIIAAAELCQGRRWDNHSLFVSVSARCILAFVSMIAWLYACYLMLVVPGFGAVLSLTIQAPCALLFNGWAYVENLRVRYVLNPEVPTSNLERTLIIEREKLLRM